MTSSAQCSAPWMTAWTTSPLAFWEGALLLCLCSRRVTFFSSSSTKSAGLSEYAKHCLKEICSQEWVREKLLKNPENLFDSDLLLDNMLSQRQAQQLVQMICYPGGIPSVLPLDEDDEDEEPEEQRHITRILQVRLPLHSHHVSMLLLAEC